MATAPEASELLWRWQELRNQGTPTTPEELCAGCPERAAELRKQIQAIESMEAMLGVGADGPASTRADGTADAEEQVELPGYELLGELGRGGMGVVYRARQTSLDRLVAVKMIAAGPHALPRQRERFRTEAAAVARLQHPNVVQVFEAGEAAGRRYFAMEHMDGGSLADRLAGVPMPPAAAAQLLRTLAGAVHYAHERGVLHRDLKPANVLLTTDGTPKIADFGLAKLLAADGSDAPDVTIPGAVLGTPSYLAPEQAEAKPQSLGPATDVYGLGAILYELLTGRPPFRGATTLDTLDQVRSQEPVPPRRLQPKVPRDLETVCLKCLQKDPAQRYPSAAELADDLGRFLDGMPVRAKPTPAWRRCLAWARRRPAAAALVAVSLASAICLLSGGAWFTAKLRVERDHAWQAQADAERERDDAQQQRARAQAILLYACEAVDKNAKVTIERKQGLVRDPVPGGVPYSLACVYALAARVTRHDTTLAPADRDQLADRYTHRALEMLNDARAEGYFADPARRQKLTTDPDLEPLRSHPRFQDLLNRADPSARAER
jgi:predicted Ser/Thr protein kinase